ncbi:Thaumatin family [Dillenia turbinata]|uniref:Thaumatin family n=1 Tax=Dillenia turbinata TaxID=194707 RepID=A0AAN8ZMX1_9MAGN
MRSSWFVKRVTLSESARIFTITNDCKVTIWPGITPGENFDGGGFALKPDQSIVFTAPVGWEGRIWARTGCNFDKNGNGSCQTGSCGNTLKCSDSGKSSASLAEFTLATVDYYDVSLVDGFNLPVVVTPINGTGNCSIAGCDRDLLPDCPKELAYKVNGKTVACRSACDVFNTDEYCCRGVYGNPVTCTATSYSKKFKEACPAAYSYAYDDPTSIFTCSGTDYVITFCSSRRQPVCTYHNNRLVCSGSKGLGSFIGKWPMIMMLTLFFVVNLWNVL